MGRKSAKLKDLKITSTDLVDAGANPDAHIRLFKRKGDEGGEPVMQRVIAAVAGVFGKGKPVAKEAMTFDDKALLDRLRDLSNEAWNFCYVFSESLCSIICESDMGEDDKREKMFQSLDEFAEAMRNAIPGWASGNSAKEAVAVEKSAAVDAAFGELIAKYVIIPDESGGEPPARVEKTTQVEEEFNTMNIDKSKLTPEELAALEAIEKKYGNPAETPPVATPAAGDNVAAPELHPEVKKALADIQALTAQNEELQKSLEVKDLSIFATKYEVLGKKADELAPKLYELKKAGGTVYDDYVALLDEQLTLVEKSGMFGEIGSARSMMGIASGNELTAKTAEIRKANSGMSEADALVKAFEENPELAAKYEAEYAKQRRVN
ncbi:MAG: hypothetical protein FWB91_00160 [Defluviitaleaceae bacterium]|nr:hypothetical protein [Defluviitaleaceae bacterium]